MHGWGNCGRALAREMSGLTRVCLIPSQPLTSDHASNILEYALLNSLTQTRPPPGGSKGQFDAPVLVGVEGKKLTPILPVRGTMNVAYTFFQRTSIAPETVEYARKTFDCVLTGSTYCTDALKAHGVASGTIIQGIDPDVFHPLPQHRKLFQDNFLIFSGGKFEYRKGQDLTARAFKVMQDRHPDVALIAAWTNYSQEMTEAMSASPYVKLPPPSAPEQAGDYRFWAERFLHENGVDPNRVILVPRQPQESFAPIYHQTDVGIFPSRNESGTNLVLMEYMACGKPAIASWTSGHRDILTDANSIILRSSQPVNFYDERNLSCVWDDPSLDELIEKLEWAYQHRDELRHIGQRAGQDLARLTWARTANDFYDRLSGRKPLAD
jgi:glycosyltransferase involved in cell wall biosynthesis